MPDDVLPPGSRVRVIHDPDWSGPWREEFPGTVTDTPGPPEPLTHPAAHPGELAYWIAFDAPQYDADGAGPYRKAQIWARHLLRLPPTFPPRSREENRTHSAPPGQGREVLRE